MNEKQGDIVDKLARIAGQITHISKDQKNQGQGFKFRGIDQVLAAIHNPFAEEGIIVLPSVKQHQVFERPTKSGGIQYHHIMLVEYTFTSTDGSSVACTAPGESLDSGDKGMAKCMSIAFKTVIFQLLTLPVEEQSVEDPDRHSPEETSVPMATEEQKLEIEECFDKLNDQKVTVNALKWAKADHSKGVNGLTAKQATQLLPMLRRKIAEQTEPKQ